MIDRDRLIKAWNIFRDSNPYQICDGREFRAIKEPEYCMGQMIEDTIALLKEQEPKTVLYRDDGEYCPWCSTIATRTMGVQRLHLGTHYCPYCGQGVKWE